MNIKKIFLGEPIPDKEEKYKKIHDEAVSAGQKFARYSGLAWLGQRVIMFSDRHRMFFVSFVFALVLFLGVFNIMRLFRVVKGHSDNTLKTSVEMVDSTINKKLHNK